MLKGGAQSREHYWRQCVSWVEIREWKSSHSDMAVTNNLIIKGLCTRQKTKTLKCDFESAIF